MGALRRVYGRIAVDAVGITTDDVTVCVLSCNERAGNVLIAAPGKCKIVAKSLP